MVFGELAGKGNSNSAKEIYTYADYALLPEGAPYQLIGGKLVMTPAPTTYHQTISMRLIERLLFLWQEKI